MLQHSLQLLRLFALPSIASYCLIHFDVESRQLARRAVSPGCVGGGEFGCITQPPKKIKKGAQIAERGSGKRNVLNIKKFSGKLV